MQERSLFLTPPPAFVICGHINDSHADRCEVAPRWGFDLHFSFDCLQHEVISLKSSLLIIRASAVAQGGSLSTNFVPWSGPCFPALKFSCDFVVAGVESGL